MPNWKSQLTTARTQTFSKAIGSAANAGDVLVGTVNIQACLVKSVTLRSNGATTADLTNAAVYAGTGKVHTFISPAMGVRANIAAIDQQVSGGGAALGTGKTIVITLTGTGATAVDLTVVVEYVTLAEGGFIS